MIASIRILLAWGNHHAEKLFLVGLFGVGAFNWFVWQRDNDRRRKCGNTQSLLPLEDWPRLPKVSVLVAAWNEAAVIEEHIHSFLKLRYPRKELVLCAGGQDGTYDLALRFAGPQVNVLEQRPGEGKQRALSRGLHCSTGEIIYFTDADCLLDNDSFERVVHPIAVGEESVCSGGSKPYEKDLALSMVAMQAASDYVMFTNPGGDDFWPGLLGRNAAVSRNALRVSGALQAAAPSGTDFVLAKKLLASGFRIFQVRSSLIASDYPRSARAYVRQKRRWLRNVTLRGLQQGAYFEVFGSLGISGLGLGMLLLPILALWWGKSVFCIWLLSLAQGALSRTRYVLLWSRYSDHQVQAPVYVFIPLSLFLDFLSWAAPLLDYLIPSRRYTW